MTDPVSAALRSWRCCPIYNEVYHVVDTSILASEASCTSMWIASQLASSYFDYWHCEPGSQQTVLSHEVFEGKP